MLTNDQKLLLLISKADELLKALDTQDKSNDAAIFKQKSKTLRKDLALWIGLNRTVTTAKTPVVRKKPNQYNHNQNWLAQ